MKAIFKYGRAQLIADEGKIPANGVDVYGYDITLVAVPRDSVDENYIFGITPGNYHEVM